MSSVQPRLQLFQELTCGKLAVWNEESPNSDTNKHKELEEPETGSTNKSYSNVQEEEGVGF